MICAKLTWVLLGLSPGLPSLTSSTIAVAESPTLERVASTQDDEISELKKRIARLEGQVAELRRQAGLRTAVEAVADQLKRRRPTFRRMNLPDTTPVKAPINTVEPGTRPIGPAKPVAPAATTVVMTVDGAKVTKEELDDLVRFAKGFVRGSDSLVLRHVLENTVIPSKSMEARFAKNLPSMRMRAETLRASIVDGQAKIEDVARERSDCKASKENGGLMEPLERNSSPMLFTKAAFETPLNEISPVFLTERGYHFLAVESKGKKDPEDPAAPLVVTSRHVLIAYPEFQGEPAPVVIELRDPAYRNAIPPGFEVRESNSPGDAPKDTDGDADRGKNG